jgi:hypothetical protein
MSIDPNNQNLNNVYLIDSPSEPTLTGNATLAVQFRDYVRFRPDAGGQSDNIYVTLGVETWGLDASETGGVISTNSKVSPYPSIDTTRNDFPYWTSFKSKGGSE